MVMVKMKKWLVLLGCVIFAAAVTACQTRGNQPEEENTVSKRVIMYYPNWIAYRSPQWNVDQLPWGKFTHINHAFWTVSEDFLLEPTDSWMDMEWNQGYVVLKDGSVVKTEEGKEPPAVEHIAYSGQFAMYKAMLQEHEACILISVGGWTRGENFSEMASSPANRKVFIDSVIKTLQTYEWLGGIDLDWEYPSVDRMADPMDPLDRGCPGDPLKDGKNFTALLKELREAMDNNQMENKVLSICEYMNANKLVEQQELEEVPKYVDYINIMTYDVFGTWRKDTGPLSPARTPEGKTYPSVETAVESFLKFFKPEQLNIGVPFYSRGWGEVTWDEEKQSPLYQLSGPQEDPYPTTFFGSLDATPGTYGVYAWEGDATGKWKLEKWPELEGKQYGTKGTGQEPWSYMKQLENTPGWISGYDEESGSAWLYHPEEKKMYTYESSRSLQDKIDFVQDNKLGGIYVWEMTGDDQDGFPMSTQIWDGINK